MLFFRDFSSMAFTKSHQSHHERHSSYGSPTYRVPRTSQNISPSYAPVKDLDALPPNTHAEAVASAWRPGVARRFPWLGVGSLLLVTLCSIACGLLLRLSDGQPTDTWRFSPTVYLAILYTSANITLAFALRRGATNAWWALAVEGASIRKLHHNWQHGSSVWSSIRGLFRGRFDLVALAVILAAVALVDGPLLQRASIVVARDSVTEVPMKVTMAPQTPAKSTGDRTGRLGGPTIMMPKFAKAVAEYNTRSPMRGSFEGDCTGNCAMTVQAAALAKVNCSSKSVSLDYRKPTSDDSNNVYAHPVGSEWPAFAVSLVWSSGEEIDMDVERAETDNCTGTYTTTSCKLVSASASYNVRLRDSIITFASGLSDPPITAIANNSNAYYDGLTLGGYALAASDAFSANVSLYFTGVWDYQFQKLNTFATGYVNDTNQFACQRTWGDPTDDIMAALNEVAFRFSLSQTNVTEAQDALDPSLQMTQSVNASQTQSVNVFQTLYAPMWVAIVLMNLGVVGVLTTFLGWRALGRDLSLDPLETARAFRAPIFRGEVPADAPLEGLVQRTGDRFVRYQESGTEQEHGFRWVRPSTAVTLPTAASKPLMPEELHQR